MFEERTAATSSSTETVLGAQDARCRMQVDPDVGRQQVGVVGVLSVADEELVTQPADEQLDVHATVGGGENRRQQ
jgi:hypothetical protein